VSKLSLADIWLQAVVHAANVRAAGSGERFTLSALAAQLLTLGVGAHHEVGAERDRLQALITIRRTGSDPKKCARAVAPEEVPQELGAEVIELHPKPRAGPAGRRRTRYFQIDAVARADRPYPGSARWYQPLLLKILTPPSMSVDDTRALLALELAKLGYVRSQLTANIAARGQSLAQANRDAAEADIMWDRALTSLSDLGTIEAAGVLALLLHDARLSFAPKQLCEAICDALVWTIAQALGSIDAAEAFEGEITDHIHERLLLQRWQADAHSRESLFLGPPLCLTDWVRIREQHPRSGPAISSLPDIPPNPHAAAETIVALHEALARVAPDLVDPSRPSLESLRNTGIGDLQRK
jgi:hypothetical protein